PWWFLAAIAFKESSFNPQALNSQYRCYGLMQFTPSNWLHYSIRLGFDPKLDRDNPRAQILCGAFMLKELGLKFVDWESADWQEQTLDVLVFYGGFRNSDAISRCLQQYAEPIWKMAEEFKTPAIIWPVPGHYAVTSNYGMRTHPVTGEIRMHSGIDIGAPSGVPVVSVSNGIVITASWVSGYGNYVSVKDQFNEYSYAHLNSISVRTGQEVSVGTELGKVGSTGISTGPHLHFEIKTNGSYIDPLTLLINVL
ncbi:MAG: M23 family metallopeptidase, partial [Peptococcaceae bacterium]|nr:M23 family metallopeptidase [Peptococcaceae bacterium]